MDQTFTKQLTALSTLADADIPRSAIYVSNYSPWDLTIYLSSLTSHQRRMVKRAFGPFRPQGDPPSVKLVSSHFEVPLELHGAFQCTSTEVGSSTRVIPAKPAEPERIEYVPILKWSCTAAPTTED